MALVRAPSNGWAMVPGANTHTPSTGFCFIFNVISCAFAMIKRESRWTSACISIISQALRTHIVSDVILSVMSCVMYFAKCGKCQSVEYFE